MKDMVRNCSIDDLDLILGSMLFVTESLITRTLYRHAVLIVMLLTHDNTFKNHLSLELESGAV